jgi:hypothetical protein
LYKMFFRYPRSFMKIFPKHSREKIQHSLKTVRKKKLLVTTASKIVQRSKRLSCVNKNKIGYSCNIGIYHIFALILIILLNFPLYTIFLYFWFRLAAHSPHDFQI